MVVGHIEKLAIGKPLTIRPVLCARLPQDHTDFVELVHFTRAWEKWLERVQFCHDASKRENVNRIVV